MKDVDICNAGERFPDDSVLRLEDGNITNEENFCITVEYQIMQCLRNLGSLLLAMAPRMEVLLIELLRKETSISSSKELFRFKRYSYP